MPPLANILVVSDLHFGEELLPGASSERRHAVDLGASAFREFLRYHTVRRRDGRPWRLVIAGDLFDFMSVFVGSLPERPAKTADERRYGLGRGVMPGVERLKQICAIHRPLLADLAAFAAAGHSVDIIVGNHDIELLAPEVAAELVRQLGLAGATERALSRISVVPWFIYIPGVVWIEHGHVYDEGCSFEFNLAPMDPKDGWLVYNADYAAVRYLGSAVPDLDPHGIEEWSFWGYMRYAMGQGVGHMGKLWLAYGRFVKALFSARALHRSFKRRDRRRREHRARLAHVAEQGGLSFETASAIDRLSRTPLTVSTRRLGRMLMLDRFGLGLGLVVTIIALLVLVPVLWALVGAVLAVLVVAGITRWLGRHMVTSQLPMRAVPQRLRKFVDAPIVVFGHTHDPRWQRLRSGGVYINCGTWLPATRPGIRRSFTHVFLSPSAAGGAPVVELRQWREGTSQVFDAGANIGAGVNTLPGFTLDQTGG
ncbi:MAG: metallophosphoesterase [Myxococcales bacterium]|nr:metallophosphoesterase [Myxococcales bacterium]